jgi:hypothetical protein
LSPSTRSSRRFSQLPTFDQGRIAEAQNLVEDFSGNIRISMESGTARLVSERLRRARSARALITDAVMKQPQPITTSLYGWHPSTPWRMAMRASTG